MARLIHYAFHVPGVKTDSQLTCVEALCRLVDAKFTQTAMARFKQVMWQAHEGVDEEEMLELAASVTRQSIKTAEELSPIAECADFTDTQIADVIERAALVLCRTTLQGNSANFPFLHSSTDLYLPPFLPTAGTSWFRWLLTRTDILASAVGMAGAALVVYAYFTYFYVFKKRSKVPCQCRLCKGTFVLGQELGSGGFGKVYKCTKDDSTWVIKLIQVDPANNVNDIQDAIDEATSLVRLKHPNIVGYQDVFIHRNETEVDFMCIVMELCDKGSLLDMVSEGKLGFEAFLNALRQILEGLVYTHSQGVLHCDVKLDNIFVLSDPSGHDRFKIGDFGLATQLKLRAQSELRSATPKDPLKDAKEPPHKDHELPATSASSATGSGGSSPLLGLRESRRRRQVVIPQDHDMFTSTVGGTPCYQPPEVFQRMGVTPASDVWAVACLVFEATTRMDVPDNPPLGERAMTGEKRWGAEKARLAEVVRTALERMVRGDMIKDQAPLEDPWNQEEDNGEEEEDEDEGEEGDEGDEEFQPGDTPSITYFKKKKREEEETEKEEEREREKQGGKDEHVEKKEEENHSVPEKHKKKKTKKGTATTTQSESEAPEGKLKVMSGDNSTSHQPPLQARKKLVFHKMEDLSAHSPSSPSSPDLSSSAGPSTSSCPPCSLHSAVDPSSEKPSASSSSCASSSPVVSTTTASLSASDPATCPLSSSYCPSLLTDPSASSTSSSFPALRFDRLSCCSSASSSSGDQADDDASDENEGDSTDDEDDEGDEEEEDEKQVARPLTITETVQVQDLVQMFKDMLAAAPWERPTAAALLKYSIMKEAALVASAPAAPTESKS